mmetsp:Transcript_19599/g.43706  ORF Transcript_19599/g.43706 Transcript_19599/m.43706 type:complete len:253 (+) Transcript_19599:648-1406(+)
MRPGRTRAGSSISGLFVAATTTTWPAPPSPCPCTPSSSVSNCDNTRSLTPEDTSPLLPANASISSKNMMVGAAARALRNSACTAFSLSPSHLLSSSGPRTARKFILLSVASAFAIRVFEHPGGPYSSTPLGGLIPAFAKSCGCSRGHSTTSLRLCLTSCMPPMSDQRTQGTSTTFSRRAEGVTRRTAASSALSVIADLVPTAAVGAVGAAIAVSASVFAVSLSASMPMILPVPVSVAAVCAASVQAGLLRES